METLDKIKSVWVLLLAQLLGQLFGELIQNVPTQGEVLVFLNSIKLGFLCSVKIQCNVWPNCIFYMYKIVISYFSVCPIITHEHLTDWLQTLIGELGRTTRMFLTWFLNSKMSGSKLKAKIQFPGKSSKCG